MNHFEWPVSWSVVQSETPELVDPVIRFANDLLRFNRSQNLISRKDPERQVRQLLWESVCAAQLLPAVQGASMDLGSGAGLPGLVLAIAHPGSGFDLLERRGGRCEFLRREVAALGLENVRVLERDAREAAGDPALAGRYARVWLKAVAPPAEALELARPFLAPGGNAILLRQADWLPEKELPENWSRIEKTLLPPEPSGRPARPSAAHVFHI